MSGCHRKLRLSIRPLPAIRKLKALLARLEKLSHTILRLQAKLAQSRRQD
jgi:hypothetical protein